jgi:putative aldouronate transport system permease protein
MKKNTLSKQLKTEWPLHLFLLPAVILLLIFSYLPMVGIVIAFQDYVPSKGWDLFFRSEWVGFDNFTYIMSMPGFWRSMVNTLTIAIQKILVSIIVPLFIALLLNEAKNRLFKKAVQTLIYIPYFFSWVILGGILMNILSPSSGVINHYIKMLGGNTINFLGNPNTIQPVFIVTNIWKEVGYNTVIFLAALTSIDPGLYEAASVDGAGYFKQMVHVTLPSLVPMILLVTILGMGNILNAGFDQVFNLYAPVVYDKADIIDTFVYRIGMDELQYSVSTAINLFKSVISLVLITSSFHLAKKYAGYRIF